MTTIIWTYTRQEHYQIEHEEGRKDVFYLTGAQKISRSTCTRGIPYCLPLSPRDGPDVLQ